MDNEASNQQTAEATTPAAANMEAFFTRQRANEGITLPLDFPDGRPSEHFIRIRGIDSDAFRLAQAESYRRLQEVLTNSERKVPTEEEMITEKLTVLSSLVSEWSFPQPCISENVSAFLREAPQITEEINQIAGNRTRFFRRGSKTS